MCLGGELRELRGSSVRLLDLGFGVSVCWFRVRPIDTGKASRAPWMPRV